MVVPGAVYLRHVTLRAVGLMGCSVKSGVKLGVSGKRVLGGGRVGMDGVTGGSDRLKLNFSDGSDAAFRT